MLAGLQMCCCLQHRPRVFDSRKLWRSFVWSERYELACRCIVASSTGRGVFDGNVQVNQKAQQTDAAQLSRNLLLAARGAVFARPNLQIIADDVSCTHGCTVSDLEDDQLFYFT